MNVESKLDFETESTVTIEKVINRLLDWEPVRFLKSGGPVIKDISREKLEWLRERNMLWTPIPLFDVHGLSFLENMFGEYENWLRDRNRTLCLERGNNLVSILGEQTTTIRIHNGCSHLGIKLDLPVKFYRYIYGQATHYTELKQEFMPFAKSDSRFYEYLTRVKGAEVQQVEQYSVVFFRDIYWSRSVRMFRTFLIVSEPEINKMAMFTWIITQDFEKKELYNN
jgi:hypothetical protein